MARIDALISDDRQAVDRCIRENLRSEVALIDQVSDYIIGAGGKRLRPVTLLLSAHAAGYEGEQHIPLAAIVEFIHTATLLHDDVVDESERRRGRETAHAIWGNAASVLVGDFLYSRSFQMMVAVDRMAVMRILADATNTIAEGEVMQLLNAGNPETTEAAYLETIRCKTAALFSAATELGGVLAEVDEQQQRDLATYGEQLGIAFQIADDILDLTAADDVIGKNVGDDLAEGKPTLPIIHALADASEDRRQVLSQAIRDCDRSAIGVVLEAVRDSNAIDYAIARAEQAVDRARSALSTLPSSPYRECLFDLADFALRRDR